MNLQRRWARTQLLAATGIFTCPCHPEAASFVRRPTDGSLTAPARTEHLARHSTQALDSVLLPSYRGCSRLEYMDVRIKKYK